MSIELRRPLILRLGKTAVGLSVALLALLMCEIGTRAYVAVRRGGLDTLKYGFSFWDSIRTGAATAAERELAARVDDQTGVDAVFTNRDDETITGTDRRPETVRIAGYDVHFNALGLRGPDIQLGPDRPTRRLLVLGGSFVFGWGLPDDATWTTRLQEAFGSVGTTEVVNGGRNGGTINWALMTLVRLNRRMGFERVLLLSTYNNRTLITIDGRPTWAANAEYYLYNSSLLYVVLEEKLSQLRHQAVDYEHWRSAVRVSPAALEQWRSLYRRRIDQIATICRERESQLVVGAEPQRFFDRDLDAVEPGDRSTTVRLLRRIDTGATLSRSELDWLLQSLQIGELRAAGARGRATFIDTASAFMPDKATWMMDEIHPNRRGSERFAAVVARGIERSPSYPTR